jgi:hypothetical protein
VFQSRFRVIDRPSSLLMLMNAALALTPWILVLLSANRGFDRTDEAFYLLSIAHPEDVMVTFSMFGAALNPLFKLVGGNSAALRVLGAFILWMVSVYAAWLTLTKLEFQAGMGAGRMRLNLLLTLFVSSGASLYYFLWLLTPSYNWLALVGLIVFWGGFVLWIKSERRTWSARMGTALFAFAAALVFWAKPTSAALIVLYPLGALALERRHWRRLLDGQSLLGGAAGFAAGMSLPLLSGFSPQAVITVLSLGVEHQNVLKPSVYAMPLMVLQQALHQTAQLFTENVFIRDHFWVWLTPLIGFALLSRLKSNTALYQRRVGILLVGGLSAALVTAAVVLSDEAGRWALTVPLLIALYMIAGNQAQRRLSISRGANDSQQNLLWLIPILGLVFIFVFGTTNPYAMQAGMSAFFPMLAAALLLRSASAGAVNHLLMHAALPIILLSVIWLTAISSLTPYRQNVSVWQMDYPVQVDQTNTLVVSQEMGRYIHVLQTAASEAGFQPETPLIDLTGSSPGAAYVLRGRAYVFPWLLGDYPGSDLAAVFILSRWHPQDLAAAWVLTADREGAPYLTPSILREVGLDFPADYERVGEIRLGDQTQILWRPNAN